MVEKERCTGCGACAAVCPPFYPLPFGGEHLQTSGYKQRRRKCTQADKRRPNTRSMIWSGKASNKEAPAREELGQDLAYLRIIFGSAGLCVL